MFDDYAKKLKELQEDVPKIFERVAKRGAIEFVNKAKDRTQEEGLVDTHYYEENWNAEAINPLPEVYGVECRNPVEYASFLEFGHKLRNGGRWRGRFVGRLSMEDAEFFCIEELEAALEKAYKKK